MLTSESVTEGHSDKVADQISDAILDAILSQDPKARVDAETLLMRGNVIVTGQITTTAHVNYDEIVRGVLCDIGFDNAKDGIDWATCGVMISIDKQSPDIAMGVNKQDTGSGDSGIVYGYANRDTPELMPLPIMLANALARRLAWVRKQNVLKYLRPDGKTQVTVEYVDARPTRIDAIVIAAQHAENIPQEQIKRDLITNVVNAVVPKELLDANTRVFVNETGRFTIGGTLSDSGLTGRKTEVDAYGGHAHQGGGCKSGKDATKVDRSGSYMARYVAKNIVAAELALECEVQVAYAIGVATPVSIDVRTFGTGVISDERITEAVKQVFNFSPKAIIDRLTLQRPIYRKTATYGHFGRGDPDFTWERTDVIDELKHAAEA
jgi:S-adenosylmethionine synthetase